jgi:hypothetical protein
MGAGGDDCYHTMCGVTGILACIAGERVAD